MIHVCNNNIILVIKLARYFKRLIHIRNIITLVRKVSNDRHDITETEADFIATKKANFWLKRASSAMAKTKAMCIINRSTKLISIQHEKKHGKGSKNSSAYFDSRIEIEQETDNLIADYRLQFR